MIKQIIASFVGMVMCGSVFASNVIELLQNSVFPQYSDTITLGDALTYSELCENSKSEWSAFKNRRGETIVEFRCKNPSFNNLDDLRKSGSLAMLRFKGISEEAIKNPMKVLQLGIKAKPNEYYKLFGKSAVDTVCQYDADNNYAVFHFAQSKVNPNKFTYRNAFMTYEHEGQIVAKGELITDIHGMGVLEAVYTNHSIVPNLDQISRDLKLY
jgi:hypothetical protein